MQNHGHPPTNPVKNTNDKPPVQNTVKTVVEPKGPMQNTERDGN